jgi:molybdopterin converting factor small subunit
VSRVVLELYGIARRRAGREEVAVEAATLGEALCALVREVPDLEGEVVRDGELLADWRANLSGARFVRAPTTPLPPGSRVLILSAIAGG